MTRKEAEEAAEAERIKSVIGWGGTTTTTRGPLRALLLKSGDWFFWNGNRIAPRSKHIGAGVYKVWGEVVNGQ